MKFKKGDRLKHKTSPHTELQVVGVDSETSQYKVYDPTCSPSPDPPNTHWLRTQLIENAFEIHIKFMRNKRLKEILGDGEK